MSPVLGSNIHTTFLFCLSSRKSLFSQDRLLSHLLDFQYFGIACSHALKTWLLRSDQHSQTPIPSKTGPQGTLLTSSFSCPKSALSIYRTEVLMTVFLLSPALETELLCGHYDQDRHQSPLHPEVPLCIDLLGLPASSLTISCKWRDRGEYCLCS